MTINAALIRSMVVALGVIFTLAVAPAFAARQNLVGAVVKTDQGSALSTAGGEYLFLGKDLSGMIGKTVSVTGDVEHGVLTSTIQVNAVKVLSNQDLIDPPAPKTAAAGSRSPA